MSKAANTSWVGVALATAWLAGCGSNPTAPPTTPTGYGMLTATDVQTLIAHAVELAKRSDQPAVIAVVDRQGGILGIFRMTASGEVGPYSPPTSPEQVPNSLADFSVQKARTAAFLSSNQHAFSTLTACFITRNHFPPDIHNTPAGPLYGVPFSSQPGGDILPNGNGLTGAPGGVPIFKNRLLAGGIGITTSLALTGFELNRCGGSLADEVIALGAVRGAYEAPPDLRGDGIFLDGIRLLFANSSPPAGGFTLSFAQALADGAVDASFSIIDAPVQRFPGQAGYVNLDAQHDFNPRDGSRLTSSDVDLIRAHAEQQANRTRAAIRRPLGAPAQVFISVVDLDGDVLGIWRTPDATLFSFDVSVQKARSAVAFSDPTHPLGIRVRTSLGLPAGQPLAMSTRAIGFLAQDFFPPGIDFETDGRPVQAGPLFQGPEFVLQKTEGLNTFGTPGNGITIFPGGIPLYKNGVLAGGIGISGDGVDQDDLIAFAGTVGFEPPGEIRSDRFSFQGVRLPFVKLPRQPELP